MEYYPTGGSGLIEVITAAGVGKSTEDRVPLAIFRRSGQKTTYVPAIGLDGKAAPLSDRENEGAAVDSLPIRAQ